MGVPPETMNVTAHCTTAVRKLDEVRIVIFVYGLCAQDSSRKLELSCGGLRIQAVVEGHLRSSEKGQAVVRELLENSSSILLCGPAPASR